MEIALILGPLIIIGIVLIFWRLNASRQRKIASGQLPAPVDANNTLAALSLVLVFLAAVPGIVSGHIALSQIKRSGERGWGLAVAALCIGYVLLAGGLALTIGLAIARR